MPKAKPPTTAPANVGLSSIVDNQSIAADAEQKAVQQQIENDRAVQANIAAGRTSTVVIAPGGRRMSFDDLHLDARHPMDPTNKMLAETETTIIRPECRRPGYVYVWARWRAEKGDDTQSMMSAGIYERVTPDIIQPYPGAGIATVTLPNGDKGITWKGHMCFRMSPENYNRYVLHWEREGWRRQVRQTGSDGQGPGGNMRLPSTGSVQVESKVENQGQETVLIPQ